MRNQDTKLAVIMALILGAVIGCGFGYSLRAKSQNDKATQQMVEIKNHIDETKAIDGLEAAFLAGQVYAICRSAGSCKPESSFEDFMRHRLRQK